MPSSVTVVRRLRPIRLGFLTRRPTSSKLRRIAEVNTILWGGRFNPILPNTRRMAQSISGEERVSPAEYLSGLLDRFLPDYLVEVGSALPKAIVYDRDRVVDIKMVVDPAEDSPIGYGIDMFWVYQHLYEHELRYRPKDAPQVVIPQAKDRGFDTFIAAVMGAFPNAPTLEYIRTAFTQAFDAASLAVGAEEYASFIEGGFVVPSQITSHAAEQRRWGWHDDPTLFVLDATKPEDILDYWNLRALGTHALAVPKQWISELADVLAFVISEYDRPIRRNPSVRNRTTILLSGNCEATLEQEVRDALGVLADALVVRRDLPPIWKPWTRTDRLLVLREAHSTESSDDIMPSDSWIDFSDVPPPFDVGSDGRGTPRWANVIELRDFTGSAESASVLPPELRDWGQVVEPFGLERPWLTREGVVLPCTYQNWRHRWRVPTPARVMQEWLNESGVKFELSAAGRIALNVAKAVGGTHQAAILRHGDLLKQLNRMAHGEVEIEVEANSAQGRRKAFSPAVSRAEFLGLLTRIYGNNRSRAANVLKYLTDRHILRIGLRVQCAECHQRSWYPLEDLAESLLCPRCVQQFRFPADVPPQNGWYYRVMGPFAVENYAQGAYCSLLAGRLLSVLGNSDLSWVPAFKMFNADEQLEVDFGAFWRRERWASLDAMVVFGECKSFGDSFDGRDVQRMRKVGRQFPGSVLVFATLRSELRQSERRRLAGIAYAGRKTTAVGKWRNPVVVLTAHELFAGVPPPDCWKEAGLHSPAAASFRYPLEMEQLAEATQCLHLGLDSYWSWADRLRTGKGHRSN